MITGKQKQQYIGRNSAKRNIIARVSAYAVRDTQFFAYVRYLQNLKFKVTVKNVIITE